MMEKYTWAADPDDIRILRDLFIRKREFSENPVMEERKELWTNHASLNSLRPMILAETMGVLDELIPLSILQCKHEWARRIERDLRDLVFRVENVHDDFVVEPRIEIPWMIDLGNYGVEHTLVRGDNEGKLGSYHWDPPIKDLDKDFWKLHYRSPSVDRQKTIDWKKFLEEHFGDILPVVLRASYWWTTGLTWETINLIGLEGLMLAMYDNPPGLHRLMAFLRDDFLQTLDWFEAEDLLTLNNQNDYVGSGSIGYTRELPKDDSRNGQAVCISDLWGLSESQETVGVSPRMFEEFILPYQMPVISRFGLSYYGCCEPVHTRIQAIKTIPNLRRVSVSPWCDQVKMASELEDKYIFCRKPKPTLISTNVWDEDLIRTDLRETVLIAKDCPLELVMKDVHTLNNEPRRLGRWVQIAREVCEEIGFPPGR